MKPPAQLHQADERLVAALAACQREWQGWHAASASEREAARARYHASVEALWQEIADDLRKVARNWPYAVMATDIESLARSHFVGIIAALPRLVVDPSRNVRALLVTIFRRDLLNEYRRQYAAPPAHSRERGGADATGDEKMWPSESRAVEALPPDVAASELPDPRSLDDHERIEQRLDGEKILATVWEYWHSRLSPDDQFIMEARWKKQPPHSYLEIAAALGGGWEEATVRQRHRRVLQRTRRYLEEQHMLGDELAR